MVLTLLFGKKYERSKIGAVSLDATLTEDHQYNARVTTYPVENGQIISDHIINEPITLSITGLVSDTPLAFLAAFNRSVDAFNRLITIHERKERVTVVTGIKVYEDMVITSLQVPRNVFTGQSLTFNIELQKLILDSTVRYTLQENNPFAKAPDKIPREIVADANEYPYHSQDPVTSMKDQASSGVDVGIQDLLPIPNNVLPNINTGIIRIKGVA